MKRPIQGTKQKKMNRLRDSMSPDENAKMKEKEKGLPALSSSFIA
jgi:hypothetical protein